MTSGRPIYEGKSDLDQLQKIKSSLGPVAEYQLDELQRSGKQPNVRVSYLRNCERKVYSNFFDPHLHECKIIRIFHWNIFDTTNTEVMSHFVLQAARHRIIKNRNS